jgi:hypothetical protein
MCNWTLSAPLLPVPQKHAIVRPRLNKPSLDPDAVSSNRPISNLIFASKMVERVVAARDLKHLDDNKLLPERQSAFRHFHSMEIATPVVLNPHREKGGNFTPRPIICLPFRNRLE